ncbi:MAG: hypothetical protein ACI8YC_001622, partial [Salibacteraceae bacterium]
HGLTLVTIITREVTLAVVQVALEVPGQ